MLDRERLIFPWWGLAFCTINRYTYTYENQVAQTVDLQALRPHLATAPRGCTYLPCV